MHAPEGASFDAAAYVRSLLADARAARAEVWYGRHERAEPSERLARHLCSPGSGSGTRSEAARPGAGRPTLTPCALLFSDANVNTAPECDRVAHQSPELEVLHLTGFDLRDGRLAHAENPRKLPLRHVSTLPQRRQVLLDAHLIERLLNLTPELAVTAEFPVQPFQDRPRLSRLCSPPLHCPLFPGRSAVNTARCIMRTRASTSPGISSCFLTTPSSSIIRCSGRYM